MRGLLILSIIIAIVIFLMPFILGAVIFSIAAMTPLTPLASFGLLPGAAARMDKSCYNLLNKRYKVFH
ncbi:MAG: hypothetical protein LBS35_08375 [Synergistaceae bacterium]|jgi:hypothetical protein|nr:hypothetical protein [Synergistaceae bacterium]